MATKKRSHHKRKSPNPPQQNPQPEPVQEPQPASPPSLAERVKQHLQAVLPQTKAEPVPAPPRAVESSAALDAPSVAEPALVSAGIPATVDAKLAQIEAAATEQEPAPVQNRITLAEEDGLTASEVRSVLAELEWDDQDVKDMLEETFEFLAEHFGSEHWKLSPRNLRMLSKPLNKLFTVLWVRLLEKLPDAVESWCASTPGLAGTLTAAGFVIWPRAVKQFRISRARVKSVDGGRVTIVENPAPKKTVVPAKIEETKDGRIFASGRIGD